MRHDDTTKTDPPLDELLGNLRSLFETERGLVEEGRAIEAKLDRSHAGQGELRMQLQRLEGMLGRILEGQAEVERRLRALEGQRTDLARLEGVLLRLLTSPRSGLN